jgi:hypothetical protein
VSWRFENTSRIGPEKNDRALHGWDGLPVMPVEIQAWLDYQDLQEEEVKRLVEAEVEQAGGYGQNRERGTRGVMRRVEAESASKEELYRFA